MILDEYFKDAMHNYELSIKYRKELNEINHGKYLHYIAWSDYGLGRCLLRQESSAEAKNYIQEALSIYELLAQDNDSFNKEYNKVRNVDIETSKSFCSWIGNHSHFT